MRNRKWVYRENNFEIILSKKNIHDRNQKSTIIIYFQGELSWVRVTDLGKEVFIGCKTRELTTMPLIFRDERKSF